MANNSTKPMTTNEVAAKLGLTRGRIKQLAGAGKFPGASKHGRAWMIPPKSLAAYVAGRKRVYMRSAR